MRSRAERVVLDRAFRLTQALRKHFLSTLLQVWSSEISQEKLQLSALMAINDLFFGAEVARRFLVRNARQACVLAAGSLAGGQMTLSFRVHSFSGLSFGRVDRG